MELTCRRWSKWGAELGSLNLDATNSLLPMLRMLLAHPRTWDSKLILLICPLNSFRKLEISYFICTRHWVLVEGVVYRSFGCISCIRVLSHCPMGSQLELNSLSFRAQVRKTRHISAGWFMDKLKKEKGLGISTNWATVHHSLRIIRHKTRNRFIDMSFLGWCPTTSHHPCWGLSWACCFILS